MNERENRRRNLNVAIILGAIFLGLFIISTLTLVFGFEAPPSIKKIVHWGTTIIAGIIGVLLIGAAIFEILKKTGLVDFFVKLVK